MQGSPVFVGPHGENIASILDPDRYIEHTTVDISAIGEAGLVKLGMCLALDHLIRTLNY